MDKLQLINSRKIEIANEYPDFSSKDIDDFLLKWFTIEYMHGEITRQELDEYALLMDYIISIDDCSDPEEECGYA